MSRSLPSQQQLNQELWAAATNGNVKEAGDLLLRGAQVNSQGACGYTALHWACISDKPELVRLLLANNASTNILNTFGDRPLHYACVTKSMPTVQLLMEAGCDTEVRDSFGQTAVPDYFSAHSKVRDSFGQTAVPDYFSAHSNGISEITTKSDVEPTSATPTCSPRDVDLHSVDGTTRLGEDDIADITSELSGLETKFYILGLKLHLSPNQMKIIQQNNRLDCETGFGQVIVEWILMNYNHARFGPPTWRMLVEAVNTIDHDLAKQIATNHQRRLSDSTSGRGP